MEFGQEWYGDASGPLRRADPLLMGAAFAYNALFALVPLALAFVSVLTIFEMTQQVLDNTYDLINETLPPEIATFLVQILTESVDAVEDNRLIIVIVTVLIALWSGSRAVYAVQKALRLVANSEVEVGYLRMRVTGIVVTLGAGIAVIVGYTVLIVGRDILDFVVTEFGQQGQFFAQAGLGLAAGLWVFALLFSVYRWGAPIPVPHTALTSALVTGVLFIGSWAVFNLVPSNAAASVAVFGTIGVVLLWLYGVGILVVGAPIAIGSFLRVLETKQYR
jgi:membrane protein